jgi:tetratricopeptide (TPR) repeat protein
MNENKNNSLIPIGSTSLLKIENSIRITNKILFGRITDLFIKAFCLINSKEIKSIDKDYLFLLESKPSHRKQTNYTFEANSQENYTVAIQMFQEILEINPKHAITFEMIGICKNQLNNYVGAIEYLSKAIDIDPNYEYAYNNRGNAKKNLKDYTGAIEDYSKAIDIDPNYATAYYNRGNAKCELKDYTGAIEDYSKAIDIDPNYEYA